MSRPAISLLEAEGIHQLGLISIIIYFIYLLYTSQIIMIWVYFVCRCIYALDVAPIGLLLQLAICRSNGFK